ncbi:ORF6N domain-containing protein [Muricoprocola aceti]|uniref:ORF6N domain-containing protein n=1 Tax=Muricoprocola aceti TaxID=2981772 RepID=A0ABT2SMT8_9FIRM|nr:ORF6N domain-containing protein [Muricoprocola aceti]MCU6725791.1 ORF6N domain-containing protein [Muricoprocola aceti]
MHDLKVTEYHGIRVLTSAQVAQMYETDTKTISYNFSYNKRKYIEGKHYIKLEGTELKEFKASREIPDCHKFSAHLYLWTEKGALLNAKSLNTDKAWQAYDYLVDFYFRAREQKQEKEKNEVVPTTTSTEKIKEEDILPVMKEPIAVFRNLMAFADVNGIQIKMKSLQHHNSMMYDKRIAVRENQSFERVTYEIAYELAHYCIHHKDGNLINSPLEKDYNGQAERAAVMMIHMLDVKAQRC